MSRKAHMGVQILFYKITQKVMYQSYLNFIPLSKWLYKKYKHYCSDVISISLEIKRQIPILSPVNKMQFNF